MSEVQEKFSVKCLSMGQHDATVEYRGPITKEGAMTLAATLEPLFGYYQYSKVILWIESPGGEIEGLDFLLRVLSKYEKYGQSVETRTTFMCASAAAVLLAAGRFGARSMSPHTHLLFHSSRVQSANMEWTALSSTKLSQALLSIDRKIIETLLQRLIAACGSEAALVQVISSRLSYVLRHWSVLAPQLITLTSQDGDVSVRALIEGLQKQLKVRDQPDHVIAAFKGYLVERFQTDRSMPALEAFALCLIDEIQGVIHGDQVQPITALDEQGYADHVVQIDTVGAANESRRTFCAVT